MAEGERPKTRRTRTQTILDEVRGRIAAGVYPVGGALSSEAEFCREFEASRFTIREALRRLQEEGFVSRQQGAGSTVIRAEPSAAFIQTYGSIDELMHFALATDYRVLSVEEVTLDEPLAATLGGGAGEQWTRQRGLRLDGPEGAPMALIESYIAPRAAIHAAAIAKMKPPFYSFLEMASREAIIGAVQEAQALAMPDYVADALGEPVGAVSLRLMRRYETAEGALIASFNWHLGGERFIYQSQLKREIG